MTCPKCDHFPGDVLESRAIRQGFRRRRYRCPSCFHRWTIYTDQDGRRKDPPPKTKPKRRALLKRRLDVYQVEEILLAQDVLDKDLAEIYGVSRQAINYIRSGVSWQHVRPDLPRRSRPRGGISCESCGQWTGSACAYGFPDPLEEGLWVAADCSMYQSRDDQRRSPRPALPGPGQRGEVRRSGRL